MRTLLLVLCFGVSLMLSAQTDLTGSFEFNGATRDYRLHLPPDDVAPAQPALVLNLHGYTSFAAEQEGYSRMNEVADTAGFVVCYPNGLNREWNVGWAFNRNTDDVGFLRELVARLVDEYDLDPLRVYTCGMSNGGFMSYRLACEASDVFAAAGSVTGGMVPGLRTSCDSSSRVVPVMQVHGTNDPTVAFGGSFLNDPIDVTVQYWADRHGVAGNALTLAVPDRVDDGLTTTRYAYVDPVRLDTLVDYYVVEGGRHTWPGGAGGQAGQTQDFSASASLWQFFRQFSLPPPVSVSSGFRQNTFRVWPNPAREQLHFAAQGYVRELTLYAAAGQEVLRKRIGAGEGQLDLPPLAPAHYYVRVTSAGATEHAVLMVKKG